MIERKFVAKGVRNAELEEYLESQLENADYSHADIKRTPLSTRVVVYAGRPGMVIGRSGSKIKEITDAFTTKFGITNPQIEVKSVDNPYLDPVVIAKQLAYALEKGTNYRRAVNIFLENIMGSGAIGVEICLAGKLSGARKRREKFLRGHLKKSGDSRETCTQQGKATAELKPGMVGIKVRIMHSLPDVLLIEKRMREIKEGLKPKAEEKKEEKPAEAKAEAAIEPAAVEAEAPKDAEAVVPAEEKIDVAEKKTHKKEGKKKDDATESVEGAKDEKSE